MMAAEVWLSAYGEPYDPRPAIEAWRGGKALSGSSELWDQLYHQGAVNTASYAAAIQIVELIKELQQPDWNTYALLASIEEARFASNSPAVPTQLESDYGTAWAGLLPTALKDLQRVSDDLTVRAILAVVAHIKGQHSLAAIALCTEDERQEMLNA